MRRKVQFRISDETGANVASEIVYVLRPGANLTSGGDTTISAAGSGTVRVTHPGALKSGDKVFWRSVSDTVTSQMTLDSDPSYNAGGYWEITLNNATGSDITVGTTGRLVLDYSVSGSRQTTYDQDSGGTSTVGVPSIGTNGEVEFFVDIPDIDIAVTQSGTLSGYRVDLSADPRDFVAPEEFGAVGDGSTDDTVALQKAADWSRAVGGVEIRMSGSYKAVGVTVAGDGTKFVASGDATVVPGGTGKIFTVTGNRVAFSGLRFSLGSTYDTSSDWAIYADTVSDLAVTNCYFKDGGYGLEATEVTSVQVTGCEFDGANQWGMMIRGCTGAVVSNNIAHSAVQYDGLKFAGTETTPVDNDRIVVANNVCYGNGRDGIDIAVNDSNGFIVSGNICYNNSKNGIDFKSFNNGTSITDALIEGNNCYENTEQQISIQETDSVGVSLSRITVRNNTCKANGVTSGEVGIRVSGADGILIEGNTIYNGNYGIQYAKTSNGFILRNHISDSRYPVYLEAQVSGDQVDDNLIQGNVLNATALSTTCIRFAEEDAAGADSIQGNIVAFNRLRVTTDKFHWDADPVTGQSQSDILEDQYFYMNDSGMDDSEPTSTRGRLGEVIWNRSFDTSNRVLGWVCDVEGDTSTAEWEPFGFSETMSNALDMDGNNLELGTGQLTDDTQFVEFQSHWNDLQVDVTSANTPAGLNAPDLTQFEDDAAGTSSGVYLLSFSAAQQEDLVFRVQLPHGYAEGTDIKPHVHWAPDGTDTGNCVWELEYTWQNVNGTFGDTVTDSITVAADGTALKHQVDSFTDIDGTGMSVSSIIVGRLSRNGGDGADTLTDEAFLLAFDFHIQVNSIGSDNEFAKS